jgi:hypothetical protein
MNQLQFQSKMLPLKVNGQTIPGPSLQQSYKWVKSSIWVVRFTLNSAWLLPVLGNESNTASKSAGINFLMIAGFNRPFNP